MKATLEVVVVPVSDFDRAKAFYATQVGFDLDHDSRYSDDVRVIQLTPPGSGCSIVLGREGMWKRQPDTSPRIVDMAPGSLQGLQLVVADLRATRAELLERGVDVSEIHVYAEDGYRPALDEDELDYRGLAFFTDPDGNGWAVQQISSRA